MNKFSKYLCIGALGLGLWSCSSDEPVSTEIPKFDGNKAFMNISILAPSDGTRAGTDGASADYSPGSDDENYVRKLNFYFYDKAGEFVTAYEGATYEASSNPSTGLVEEIGSSKIVLTDLLGQNYPSYVVAVLNYGVNQQAGTVDGRFRKNLAEIAKEIRTTNPWSSSKDKITDFVMTSATHNGNSDEFGYFATPITEENFALQPESAAPGQNWNEAELKAKPVQIYVERIAAKVEVSFPGHTLIENSDGTAYYQVTLPDEYEIDGVKKKLNVRLYGWGVNGQAKKVKYFKAVNDNPNPFRTTDGWNYDGTNRCYWAKTPGYGENKYSSSFDDVANKSGNSNTIDNDDAANDEPLTYISWNTVKNNNFKSGNKTAYVMPHTEAGEQINLSGQIRHSALTEVLIAGQIVDNDGNPMTLFQLSESYYTKEGVINYLLHTAGSHIWKKDGDNGFKTIEASDVDIKYGYDGTFKVIVKDTVDKWYQDNEGNNEWVDVATVTEEINSYLPDHQSYCYNDGMLYYNIPIRHLRALPAAEATDKAIKTGMYGVVRNHWYKVNIGVIKKLGHSVYRPHEHIIPPSDDTRYMIGSSINILSWRVVNSNAEL